MTTRSAFGVQSKCRKYMMARMGIVDKTMKDVVKFQKFDGVVLTFNCVWDACHQRISVP